MNRDEEQEWLRQEDQALHATNQTLREGLLEAIHASEGLQKQVKELEGVISAQQERIKTLEGQQAKDSHNSSLPPSSDRFVRTPKSLQQKSGKKPGGQSGHKGYALRQVEAPDEILTHQVVSCACCHQDLETCEARIAERRQVIDLPPKRL